MPTTSLIHALAQSFLAGGVGTGLGALPVLVVGRIGPRVESALAGFSAGVMLAAAFVGLLLPALDLARNGGSLAATWPVPAGVAAGAVALGLVHRLTPHEHFAKGREHAGRSPLPRVWLLALALTLHNLPEGLAVGVAAASGDANVSWPVTASIGAQNVPEGLIVAVAFAAAGYRKRIAVAVTFATGLVEPFGAALGYLAVQVSTAALPAALGFAAGAMLFVVSHEIIPESHRRGRSTPATFGLVLGVMLMLLFDAWLG